MVADRANSKVKFYPVISMKLMMVNLRILGIGIGKERWVLPVRFRILESLVT